MIKAYIIVYQQQFQFDHIAVYTDIEDAQDRLDEEVQKFSNVEVLEFEDDYYATRDRKHEWFITTAPLHLEEDAPISGGQV